MGRKNLSQYDEDRLLHRIDLLATRVHELEDELERAHRLITVGTMVGVITHEINNILTPVMSYAQLALQAQDDAALTQRALVKALEGAERAGQVATSVLGFVRGDERGVTANVRSTIADTIEAVNAANRDGVMITVQAATELAVAMSELSLHQILLNLVMNAREAILPDAGRIEIAARCSTWNTEDAARFDEQSESGRRALADDPERPVLLGAPDAAADALARTEPLTPGAPVVRISVNDTGPGVDPEMLARIFRPFVTNRRQRADGTRGTGLGLAICRRLVNQAGGVIDVHSTPGHGATFTITLPRADAPTTRTDDDSSSGQS